jgi:hypothetical protein
MNIKSQDPQHAWQHENGFYWYSHPSRLAKMLAHYELYKTITSIPGDVFELGVYKAASLVRFATFRQLLEHDSSRKLVAFDAFGRFPRAALSLNADHAFIDAFEKQSGHGLSKSDVESIFAAKPFFNYELLEGNVMDTLSGYLDKHPATRIALLHLDMDVKEPTEYALNLLFDRVVPGGLIVFDDYSTVAGETDAVDDFLQSHQLQIQKLPYYKIPSFVRKSLTW